jgi:hypothetical protein
MFGDLKDKGFDFERSALRDFLGLLDVRFLTLGSPLVERGLPTQGAALIAVT